MPLGSTTSETNDAAGSESDKSDTTVIIFMGWGGGFIFLATLILCCIFCIWKPGRNKERARAGIQLGAYQQGTGDTQTTGDSAINHFKRSMRKAENKFNANGAIEQKEQEVLARAIHSYLDNNLTNSRGLLKAIVGNGVYKALLKGSRGLNLIDYMSNMEPSTLEQLVGTLSPVKKWCINFIATIEEEALPFVSISLLGAAATTTAFSETGANEGGIIGDIQKTSFHATSPLNTTSKPTNITSTSDL